MEATVWGINAIAFSTFPDSLEEAAKYLDTAYDYIVSNSLFDLNPIYNINIPNEPKGIRMTYQGSDYFSDDFVKAEGENMYRQVGELIPDVCPEDKNRDTVTIHEGLISVTPLLATRTNMQVFEKFRDK